MERRGARARRIDDAQRDEFAQLREHGRRVRAAMLKDGDLTSLDKLVGQALLGKLHWKMDTRFGLMWPGPETLATAVGCRACKPEDRVRIIRRSLRRLRDAGYFCVATEGGGRGLKTYYALGSPAPENGDRCVAETVTDESENGDRLGPKTVTGESPGILIQGFDEEKGARAHERAGRSRPTQPALLLPINGAAPERGGKESANAWTSRISDDWVPSVADRDYAADRGYEERRIEAEAEAFRDHYLAKGEARADWSAAWRRWLQRAADFGHDFAGGAGVGRGSAGGPGGSMARSTVSVAAQRERAIDYFANRR